MKSTSLKVKPMTLSTLCDDQTHAFNTLVAAGLLSLISFLSSFCSTILLGKMCLKSPIWSRKLTILIQRSTKPSRRLVSDCAVCKKKKYFVRELKNLAVVCVFQTLRPYLSGQNFTVHCNKVSLQWLIRVTEILFRVVWWSLFSTNLHLILYKEWGNAPSKQTHWHNSSSMDT